MTTTKSNLFFLSSSFFFFFFFVCVYVKDVLTHQLCKAISQASTISKLFIFLIENKVGFAILTRSVNLTQN